MSAPSRAPSSARTSAQPRRRAIEPVVAVLAKRGRLLVAEPLFERGARIAIDSRGRGGAGPGELVLIGPGKRGARVARAIGRPDVARDVLEGLMLDRGLRRAFSRHAEAEAESAPDRVPDTSRIDLTGLPTFTIDPIDARDFDDAISAHREPDGSTRLWVHIADVSAYVRPGGAVEAEAYRRGTSVYVPGAVEPMLPEPLSNRACSLVPGEERLAVTVEMELRGTDVRSVRFQRSRVRSDARLNYAQVDGIFAGRERPAEPWADPLAAARAVASALRERRQSRGALEVESAEPTFRFDSSGNVVGVVHEEQTESHELIEHLMVLANEQVAAYLADHRVPTLYRVHERPDPEAVAFMVEQLASIDVPTPSVPKNMSPQQAGELAAEASRMVAAYVRRTGRGRAALGSLVLRSLKQAYYTPKNLGHAGLASARYCHFTSPIRRYPDLTVHRGLLASLGGDESAPRANELAGAGVDSSGAERAAIKIERDAADVCRAFLLERVLAERGGAGADGPAGDTGSWPSFEGEVVGLIGKGAFVRFGDQGFEGFLPVRRLSGWWSLNEQGTALVAEESGRRIRFGDSIDVSVERVEPQRGRVDLLPAG